MNTIYAIGGATTISTLLQRLSLKENLSIATIYCNLAIATHGKKIHKKIHFSWQLKFWFPTVQELHPKTYN